MKGLYFADIEWFIIFYLFLKNFALIIDSLLRFELPKITLISNVDFQLLLRHIDPATGSRTFELSYLIPDLGSLTFQLIWFTELGIFSTPLHTPDALMRIITVIGTLIAGESFADAALAGCNGELATNSADQEVELVRIGRADVEQLRLQL